jgi:hypothetical protein
VTQEVRDAQDSGEAQPLQQQQRHENNPLPLGNHRRRTANESLVRGAIRLDRQQGLRLDCQPFTDDMLAAWTSAEQLDKQKWDAAIWRFKNSPSGNDFGWWGENQAWAQICSLNDAAHQYNFLSSYAIPAIAKPFSEPIAPEPKSASWGVW